MTRQESFKRRVRARMAKTGERYTAARRALLEKRSTDRISSGRVPVSPPEISDEVTRARTGLGYDQWIEIIEAWDGDRTDHTAIVTYLHDSFEDLDYWWAQSITVGYERIVGLRLPHQRADGTFAVSKSRTLPIEAETVRSMLLEEEHRADLFPGQVVELRSKPTTKALRLAIGPAGAVAVFGLHDVGDGRTRVAVEHQGLPSHDCVDEWKYYWGEWLDALEQAAVAG